MPTHKRGPHEQAIVARRKAGDPVRNHGGCTRRVGRSPRKALELTRWDHLGLARVCFDTRHEDNGGRRQKCVEKACEACRLPKANEPFLYVLLHTGHSDVKIRDEVQST